MCSCTTGQRLCEHVWAAMRAAEYQGWPAIKGAVSVYAAQANTRAPAARLERCGVLARLEKTGDRLRVARNQLELVQALLLGMDETT